MAPPPKRAPPEVPPELTPGAAAPPPGRSGTLHARPSFVAVTGAHQPVAVGGFPLLPDVPVESPPEVVAPTSWYVIHSGPGTQETASASVSSFEAALEASAGIVAAPAQRSDGFITIFDRPAVEARPPPPKAKPVVFYPSTPFVMPLRATPPPSPPTTPFETPLASLPGTEPELIPGTPLATAGIVAAPAQALSSEPELLPATPQASAGTGIAATAPVAGAQLAEPAAAEQPKPKQEVYAGIIAAQTEAPKTQPVHSRPAMAEPSARGPASSGHLPLDASPLGPLPPPTAGGLDASWQAAAAADMEYAWQWQAVADPLGTATTVSLQRDEDEDVDEDETEEGIEV